jgi:hypothetical protein
MKRCHSPLHRHRSFSSYDKQAPDPRDHRGGGHLLRSWEDAAGGIGDSDLSEASKLHQKWWRRDWMIPKRGFVNTRDAP